MSDITSTEAVNRDRAVKNVIKELTFDEKVSDLIRFIQFEPLIRELDYKVLTYCFERRGLSDIEQRIAEYPEFKGATRDQYSLITELVVHHGLEFFELDECGNPVLEADKQGLSEDDVDDLVTGYAYKTTEVGKEVVAKLDPKLRLTELLAAAPQRAETYRAILEFLCEKHSFAEVDSMLRERDASTFSRDAGSGVVQPSVFVDKLERAGGVFYNGGWETSDAGKELLATSKSDAQD